MSDAVVVKIVNAYLEVGAADKGLLRLFPALS
jgi:hypothetical protein